MAGAPGWGGDGDGPTYSTNAWDIVWLGGIPLPGTCDVQPGSITTLKIDQGTATGRNGARLTIKGYDPKDFYVTCEVRPGEQWDRLQDAIQQLWIAPREKKAVTKSKTKKTAIGLNADGSKIFKTETVTTKQQAGFKKAVTIFYPSLVPLKVTKVVIIGVAPAVAGSQPGFKMVRWHLQEDRPPGKKATKTIKGVNDTVIPLYSPGKEPHNSTPRPPSTNPQNLRPGGPPAPPASGAH